MYIVRSWVREEASRLVLQTEVGKAVKLFPLQAKFSAELVEEGMSNIEHQPHHCRMLFPLY